jgi:hypothetical protein
MDNEIMESVLTEILEEQKLAARATQELGASLKALGGQVGSFQKKLEQQKVIARPVDTKAVQEIVADGILKIEQIVASQPKSVIRNFRLLLFPEMYADNYYRIVFGRLLFWMMIFIMATYLFMLGKRGIESWQSLKEKEIESTHALKAWRYLYQHERQVRVRMDSIWIKVFE